jgi:SAM-dependent methyltransferase
VSVQAFVDGGRQMAGELQGTLVEQGTSIAEQRTLYDWGCGCGRLLLQLGAKIGAGTRLMGSDVDREAIAWLQQSLPSADARVNDFRPPLPAGDGEVQCLVSSSILTHLTEADQDAWLADLRRVLSGDGLAVITIAGPQMYAAMRSGSVPTRSRELLRRLATMPDLEDAGFVFEPYERTRANDDDFVGVSGEYGLTFHSHDYVRERWSAHFDVVDIREARVNHKQDIVVLRPR